VLDLLQRHELCGFNVEEMNNEEMNNEEMNNAEMGLSVDNEGSSDGGNFEVQ